ncbi:MAG: restriction endonuclease subunit S [Clostridia bacterium]|nr:restriction endonuclease subunit S [Clostridia bacterium]
MRKKELDLLKKLVKSRFIEMFGDVIKNSKNWNVMTWNNVLTIKNGRNQKQVENPNGQYPICGSGGIMSYADDFISNENSVIIGRKGNINKPILMREKFWNVDTAFGLEPNTHTLLVDYLYLFCVFFDFETLNKAVTIPSLTKTDLLNIKIPIPPIELQNDFATFVEQTDKLKFDNHNILKKLQNLIKIITRRCFYDQL